MCLYAIHRSNRVQSVACIRFLHSPATDLALVLAMPRRLLIPIIALTLMTSHASAKSEQLTVTSWGGSYERSQRNAYGKSFESQTGAKIVWEEYGGGLAEIRDQIERGDVRWDVVDVFSHDARVGCEEGLFEKLPATFFHSNGIDDDLLVERPNDCVGPNILWSWLTAYDARQFPGTSPDTLSDFFDLERFPGKRAISVFPQANMEMALVADGVPPARVYEELATDAGIDRAFRKLSSLKGQLAFWSAGEEPIEMLRSGEVAMVTAYSGRVGAAALQGENFIKTIFDGQVLDEEWFVIVKGTQAGETARRFLTHVAQPEQQAAQARWIPYGPMRRSALTIIENGEPWFHTNANILPHLPSTTGRLNRSVIADAEFWAENNAAITERFAAWRRSLGY
jgi:putative spermidine/putrescine transport system substrate-binding protein